MEEEDERDARLYVGGTDGRGGGSGQSVVDPRKIMERARQNGAVSASEHEQNRSRAFVGSGYALSGEGGAAVVQNEDEKALKHSITFWKNGFSVDDGPLRDPTDPENKAFLSDINEGRVPREFQGQAEPYVSIISRATEDYKAPAVAAPRAFSGAGQTLGGGGGAAAAAAAAGPVQAATVNFAVDESAPLTTIQIRLHDGTRLTQRFNLTHTVGTIRQFVATATPGVEFELWTAFPRKALSDHAQSIADAQLQNAALTQSLK